jgi:hypothetical protein
LAAIGKPGAGASIAPMIAPSAVYITMAQSIKN